MIENELSDIEFMPRPMHNFRTGEMDWLPEMPQEECALRDYLPQDVSTQGLFRCIAQRMPPLEAYQETLEQWLDTGNERSGK